MLTKGVSDIPNKLETVSGAFGRVFTPRTDAIWIISSEVVANEIEDGRLRRLPFDTTMTKGPVGLMMGAKATLTTEQKILKMAVDNVIRAQVL